MLLCIGKMWIWYKNKKTFLSIPVKQNLFYSVFLTTKKNITCL